MKKVEEIKAKLQEERVEANKLLDLARESENQNDHNNYLRLHSKIQERIMILEWILE